MSSHKRQYIANTQPPRRLLTITTLSRTGRAVTPCWCTWAWPRPGSTWTPGKLWLEDSESRDHNSHLWLALQRRDDHPPVAEAQLARPPAGLGARAVRGRQPAQVRRKRYMLLMVSITLLHQCFKIQWYKPNCHDINSLDLYYLLPECPPPFCGSLTCRCTTSRTSPTGSWRRTRAAPTPTRSSSPTGTSSGQSRCPTRWGRYTRTALRQKQRRLKPGTVTWFM